jgi:PST family polysaccharide transporter
MGFGYWALVGMPAGQAIVNCLLVWAVSGWMPGRPARGSGVRDMLKFGGYLAGFNVVNYFSRNADNVLIGRVWGDAALGIYSRAYQLLTLPLSAAVYPLNSVVIPSLSRLQTRGREFRDTYLAFVRAAAILTFGVIATLLAVGDVLIPSLLGQKWQSATLVFQILAIAAPLQVVCGTCGSLYVSLGRGRRLLKWSSWYSAVIVASFVVGLPWGIVGVATSYVCAFYLTVPACLWYATAGTELRWWDAATVSILPFAAGLLTWLAGTATRFMIGNSHPWWVIATISFVCLITYISVVIVASRDSARNLLILLTSAYRAT